MNAPPKVGYLGRTFGWSGSRQEWFVLIGVLAWLAIGYGIHVLARRLTLGESILLYSLWLLAFGLFARDAIRNLFGPVFFYDIVRTGRQRLTFMLRWGYAVLVGFTLTMLYYSWLDGKVNYFSNPNPVVGTNELANFGYEFVNTFLIMQFIVVVLLTPVYVAGTICVDKERKILEFLFATDLRNREIIFGKLASRVCTILLFVLIGLPILALVQLFGGVDPEQLLAATVATIVTILGLSALGIWFSTMLKKARDAIMLTYLSFAAYLFVSLVAAAYSNLAPWSGWWNTPVVIWGYSVGVNDFLSWFAEGNIFWHLILMGGPRGATARLELTEHLTQYCVYWLLASSLLLGHAILRLRAVTLHQAYGSPGGTRSRKKKVDTADGSEKVVVNELTRAYPDMGDSPVFWKEVFVDSGTRGNWTARILFGLIAIMMIVPMMIILWTAFIDPDTSYARLSFAERWYQFLEQTNAWVRIVTGILTSLILIAVVVRGAGAISTEKDKDTWISLLGTSLTSDEILSGKFWGCVLGLRRVYAFLLLIWCFGLMMGAVNVFMLILDIALMFMYIAAFSWIGLYCSMTARNTLIATVRAFFAGIFFVGGFWLAVLCCCVMPLSFSGLNNSREFEVFEYIFLGLTPPFMTGWMPMYEFERKDLGPFSPSETYGIGLAAPIIGAIVWLGFTVVLMISCKWKFRTVTNRMGESKLVLSPRQESVGSEKPQKPTGTRYE